MANTGIIAREGDTFEAAARDAYAGIPWAPGREDVSPLQITLASTYWQNQQSRLMEERKAKKDEKTQKTLDAILAELKAQNGDGGRLDRAKKAAVPGGVSLAVIIGVLNCLFPTGLPL